MAPSPQPLPSISLDIYGYRVEIRCSIPSVLEGLAEDFAFFRAQPAADAVLMEILEKDPPYDTLPPAKAAVYTPRNVSYRAEGLRLIDYFGRALGVQDTNSGGFHLYGRSPELLYEAAYLFLLAQCGETLDARRLHRVHALAVSVNQRAALVLLPMGGGKSTLGSYLVRCYPQIAFLSDDSPLIDARGRVYAFPLRIGLLPGFEEGIPFQFIRRIDRMEFGPKLLVNYGWFAHRVAPVAEPGFIFLGTRSLEKACSIVPAGRSAAIRALLVNCVVGLGLFQGMEFVFQRGPGEVLRKALTAFARLRAALRLARNSQTYYLVLGRDPEENARTLVAFLTSSTAEAGPRP